MPNRGREATRAHRFNSRAKQDLPRMLLFAQTFCSFPDLPLLSPCATIWHSHHGWLAAATTVQFPPCFSSVSSLFASTTTTIIIIVIINIKAPLERPLLPSCKGTLRPYEIFVVFFFFTQSPKSPPDCASSLFSQTFRPFSRASFWFVPEVCSPFSGRHNHGSEAA